MAGEMGGREASKWIPDVKLTEQSSLAQELCNPPLPQFSHL